LAAAAGPGTTSVRILAKDEPLLRNSGRVMGAESHGGVRGGVDASEPSADDQSDQSAGSAAGCATMFVGRMPGVHQRPRGFKVPSQ
jgi:hypothetical protein